MKRIKPGPRLSQAVVHGGLVYTAGQVDDGAPDPGMQTAAILAKIDALLDDAGTDKKHIYLRKHLARDHGRFRGDEPGVGVVDRARRGAGTRNGRKQARLSALCRGNRRHRRGTRGG